MAQALRNKDVKKNCVDVEKVLMEFDSEPEREDIKRKLEPVNVKKPNKNLLRLKSNYKANYIRELKPINQVKQNLVYKNFPIY